MLEDSDEEDNEEGRVKEPRKGVLVVCTIKYNSSGVGRAYY